MASNLENIVDTYVLVRAIGIVVKEYDQLKV